MITIGIDPGIGGAVGFLRNGNFINVEDMPVMKKGSGTVKFEVDPSGLKRVIYHTVLPTDRPIVFLERVAAMPGQGVASMFSLGDSFGCARSVVGASGLTLVCETPQVWKKHFGLGKDKEECRAFAIRLFPDAPLHLKKYVDRAEALLMARYLWETRCN